MHQRTLILILAGGLLLIASPLWAELIDPRVEGNQLTADIELPDGISAELRISFEDAVGLSAAGLGLSDRLVSPTDPQLLARLPHAALTAIPTAFPVLVTIDPPVGGALSYSGKPTVELYTHNLEYVPNTPLRLFAAPLGGDFVDVTASVSSGSYRVGGSKPDLAGDYLIVADLRDDNPVIDQKLTWLETTLEETSVEIDPPTLADLEDLVVAIKQAVQSGDPRTAAEEVETFDEVVKVSSGDAIPDVWRASGDLQNVAGDLRSIAATLRFSLLQTLP